MPQAKEKQSNQLHIPQQGDRNTSQDPLNTIIRRQKKQNVKKEVSK